MSRYIIYFDPKHSSATIVELLEFTVFMPDPVLNSAEITDRVSLGTNSLERGKREHELGMLMASYESLRRIRRLNRYQR